MAKMEITLPEDIMRDIQKLNDNSEDIFKKVVNAGAEVAYKSMVSNVPAAFHGSNIMRCIKKTKVYKTPSDDGISCKVGIWGRFVNSNGELVPAPLVANVFEYGHSDGRKFPKHPFFRRSFKKGAIEAAMRAEQTKASGGLLDE